MSYNSKYSGEQVEEFLDQIANGEIGGGGIETETDPIFKASPAASITEQDKNNWSNKQDRIEDIEDIRAGAEKGATAIQEHQDISGLATKLELNDKVDKVEGKQLSTEDFTTALKNKLNSLNNYDDTEINEAVNTLREDFNTLVSGDTTTAIKSFNDITAFLNGIEDSESLDSIIASIQLEIAKKQVELISGVNIKTINGQSILGSGNIQIESDYSLPAATTNTRGGIKIGSGVIVDNTDVLHAKVNESTGLSITNNGIEIKLGTGLKVGNQNRIETNLKTINGQSIEGSGNIEIQGGGGNNTFIFDWDGTSTSGSLTEEMFNKAMSAESIIVRIVDIDDNTVEFREAEYIKKGEADEFCGFMIHYIKTITEIRNITFSLFPTSWAAFVSTINIPSKTSELTNDSKFVRSDNLKTINGNSIIGSGDIEISGGGSGGSSRGMKNILNLDSSPTLVLKPNERIIITTTEIEGLTITGFETTPFDENALNNADSWVDEYYVVFAVMSNTQSPLIPISLPDYVLWANGVYPELEENVKYELSIARYALSPATNFYKAVLTPFKPVE